MNSHKLLILTFICFSCLGLPIGHESGFLGNTTSRPGASWAPSVDLFYDLKNIDINISRNEDRNRANFSDDVLIKFGLRSPEFKLPTNRVFKGSTYSYLFGLQYRQIDTVNESTDEVNTGRTYQFSFGFKLANRKTSPIFGIYFEDEKSTSNSGSKVFGLMYSSNYNIFD